MFKQYTPEIISFYVSVPPIYRVFFNLSKDQPLPQPVKVRRATLFYCDKRAKAII